MQYGSTQLYGVKSARIVKFILALTGTYDRQYRRPFNSTIDGMGRQMWLDSIEDAKAITPGTLAVVANHFIKPAAAHEGAIEIPGGWDSRRLRFLLEIEFSDNLGGTRSEFVVGYTDHPGIAQNETLDPNMVFVINAISSTNVQIQVNGVTGVQRHQHVTDASQILVSDTYTGVTAPTQLFGLRPEDIYTQIDNQVLSEGLEEPVIAGRSLLTTRACKSRRGNAIAPVFAASILDAYLQTSRAGTETSDKDLNEASRAAVKSSAASMDSFMQFLRSRGRLESNYKFTWGDLLEFDRNAASPMVKKVVPMEGNFLASLPQAGRAHAWHGSDFKTLFAVTLAAALPGYMLNYSLSKIQFDACNRVPGFGATIVTTVKGYKSLTQNVDLSAEFASFIFRLENELLKELCCLTPGNQIGFDLRVECDVLGDTTITLSIDGDPLETFCHPTCCDSLTTPVVTNQAHVLKGIASDFSSLLNEIGDGHVRPNAMTSQNLGFI